MSLRTELLAILASLSPEICPRCEQTSAGGFCADCIREFVRIESPCRRCGLPGPCVDCPAEPGSWQIDCMLAPFRYAAPVADYLQALKYARARHLGRALGLALADAIARDLPGYDALIAVPLHRRRLRSRHFNQADEIARPLARRFCCRILTAVRTRYAPPQATLDRAARLAVPASAFAIGMRLTGLRIGIVDDVITTGATVNALAATLRAAGAARVDAIAVARTLGQDGGSVSSSRKR